MSSDRNKLLVGDSKSLLSSSSLLMSKWSLKTELTTQSGLSLNAGLQKTDKPSGLDISAGKRKLVPDAATGDKRIHSSSLKSTLLGPTKFGLTLSGSSGLSSNLTGGFQTSSNLTSRLGQSSGLNYRLGQSSNLTSNLLQRSDQSKSISHGGVDIKPDVGSGFRTPDLSSSTLKENLQSNLLKSSSPLVTIKIEPVTSLSHGGQNLHTKFSSQLSREKKETNKRKSGDKSAVKSRKKMLGNDGRVTAISRYEVKPPQYKLEVDIKDYGIHIPDFISPAQDPSLKSISKPLHDVNGMKLGFINAISGSLICQPDFRNSKDKTRSSLLTMANNLIVYDPEFILKVALYTRKQLNIRTTANFLLAMAANIDMCRPFLKKYFCSSINLPSDWIEVAEIYQAFHDRNLTQGSLPSALRRAMIAKFPDFDEYQLAKYNKESSRKKKKKKERKTKEGEEVTGGVRGGRGRGRGRPPRGGMTRGRGRGGMTVTDTKKKPISMFDSSSDSSDSSDEEAERFHREITGVVYDEGESKEEIEKTSFSLKQLIRKLHITEPVFHVMALIGKKYPNSLEEFYKCRLPGQWEEEKSGKRMKLPVPETWETQVSLKGNKASTWEDLLDHKKLPFMAMLRNLRNLIKAGISNKHHNDVIKRLTNERQVINSKQFPFRFFSAYEVLVQLENDYEQSQKDIIQEAEHNAMLAGMGITDATRGGGGRGCGRGRRGRGRGAAGGEVKWWLDKKKKKEGATKTKETPYDKSLIQRYRKALDTAVKIATVYNVQPIKGKTIVLCDIGLNMDVNCTSARGLGKAIKMKEVAVLMGLMCKYSCENCDFVVFDESRYDVITPKDGTILDNMADTVSALEKKTSGVDFEHNLPDSILIDALVDRQQIDNLIILSGGVDSTQQEFVSFFLKKFRQLVNPNLLYANISFSGKGCGFSESIKPEHDNDIYITGFSDQILKFIAERGDGGQLLHVDKIDEFFKLKPMPIFQDASRPARTTPVERPLQIPSNTPCWRTFRVFISSTFRDMHGERDVLTRFIFPELRALGKKHFINIYEIDLRWGVTEEETKSNRTLELCLSEVSKCQFFIGILGDRYGYVPDKYIVPDTPEFDWLKAYPQGASVTELEMHLGVLMYPQQKKDKAVMMIRNNSFIKDVPKEFLSDFEAEDSNAEVKMEALKSRVMNSPLENIDGYDCQWGGSVEGKPIVSGLEEFAMPIINSVWNSVRKQYPDEDAMLDETTHATKQHEAMVENHRSKFVGRKNLIKECLKQMKEITSSGGIISLTGKAGTGKSAVLSSLVTSYKDSNQCDSPANILVHIAGAAPGSTNILATLRRLCYEIRRQFALKTAIPEDYKNIIQKFGEMLGEAGSLSGSPVVVFIDGLDLMENTYLPSTMDWLPNPVPKNVIFVISTLEDSKFHNSLKRLSAVNVTVGPLDMWDKADVVRNTLAVHRKTLDESPFNNQMKLLLSKREGANPLFLKLACEELRVFGVFERINLKLKGLPHTTPALLQEVLSRLESDLGQDLVSTAISLLVCSRNGIEVAELHDLLSIHRIMSNDKLRMDDVRNVNLTAEQKLPAAMFGHLRRSLETFLNPTDSWNNRLTLAHKNIEAAVRQRYMKGMSDLETMCHRLLAGYFYQLADPGKKNKFTGNNPRAFTELPYHLVYCGEFKELQKLLCDLNFIHAKCQLGLGTQLMDDYQEKELANKTSDREQNKMMNLEGVKQYKMFVSRQIHVLNSYPALTWQQAINEPDSSIVHKDAVNSGYQYKGHSYMSWNSKPTDTDPCYMTISNLPQPVTCVAVSSDSKYFACGGMDCMVKLYDFNTGKELHTFRGHANAITSVCFVGTSMLCSAGLDNVVSVWHIELGHRIHALSQHNRRVQSCASDKAGKFIASASWDCTVKVWNTVKGDRSCELLVGSPVNCVDFHPEGQLIVTGSWDATLKIWDIFHRQRKGILRGHKTSIRDVAYSPSGRHIASASLDGDVKLWSAFNGTQVGNIQGHSLPINKLIFSPSGKELITVSDDHKVKVWSGNLGRPVQCIGQEDHGAAMSVVLNPKCDVVYVGYHSGNVRSFDALTGWEIFNVKPHTASVRCITYGEEGLLIAGSDDCTVSIMKESTGSLRTRLSNNSKPILCVTINKAYLAVGSEDFTCTLYPAPKERDFSKRIPLTPYVTLRGHIGPVTSCSFNSDGTKLATASRDASVRIYDAKDCQINPDPEPLQILHDCHKDWITGCQWSNIADILVTSSIDFNLKVWDVSTGKEKTTLTGHMAGINSMSYSYGCVVSCCSDGSVKVWSHKGTEITTLYGHTQRVNNCDMVVKVTKNTFEEEDEPTSWADMVDAAEATKSKKPKRPTLQMEDVLVATCSDDGTVRLWQPLQANELASMTGHDDRVLSVASDTQGRLCTSSLDKSVRLWSPQLSTKTADTGHNGSVTFVECIDNGSGLITGSRDGVVKFWNVTSDGFVCERSVQISKKSVNAVCYNKTRHGGDMVTATDNQLVMWSVKKDGMKIKRVENVMVLEEGQSPLTCLLKTAGTTNSFFFIAAGWNGKVRLYKDICQLQNKCVVNPVDWILSLYQSNTNPRCIFATTANGMVILMKVDLEKKGSIQITSKITVPNTVDVDVVLHKQQPVWVNCMADDKTLQIIGDSKGQITKKDKTTVKVHGDAITCVKITDDVVFTASLDRTVKVWDRDMKQVGLFFCQAPVTSMNIVQFVRDPFPVISLACGDQLGNIHFLTWRGGI